MNTEQTLAIAVLCQFLILCAFALSHIFFARKTTEIKPEELKNLKDEVAQGQEQVVRLEGEAQRLKAEAQNQSQGLAAKENEIQNISQRNSEESAAKDSEITRLKSQLQSLTEEYKGKEGIIANLTQAAAEVPGIEKSLEEEKKAVHELRLRLEESKMKVQLLNEKSKEAVESIAQFSQGKEFDEFRKTIHLDEVVQKYEDQIKSLRIEILELEKKVKGIS